MNMEVTSRVLPGIGVCQEIELQDEHPHRHGHPAHRASAICSCTTRTATDALVTLALTHEEANAVAEILGAPQLRCALAALQRQAEGLVVQQLPLPQDSPFDGKPLGRHPGPHPHGGLDRRRAAPRLRLPSPRPDRSSCPGRGDLVATVGTQAGGRPVGHRWSGTIAPDVYPAPTHPRPRRRLSPGG